MNDHAPARKDADEPRPQNRWRRLRLILLLGLGTYLVIVVGCQRAVLFPRQMLPDVSDVKPPLHVQRLSQPLARGEVEAWFVPGKGVDAQHPGPVVIFAHGNGELIDFWPSELRPYTERGVSVLLPEFRGYGRSAGKPSEKGIVEDYISFYDQVVGLPQVDAAHIIFHGRSLGGGVVAQLAVERPPAGMILESSYTSVADVARSYWVPRFLVRDPFEVRGVLEQLDVPVLIVHGLNDTIIPSRHALANHQAAPNSRLVLYENMGHNDLPPRQDYWQQIDRLLRDAGVSSTDATSTVTMATLTIPNPALVERNDAMTERAGVVTLKGNPVTLVGPQLNVGDTSPAFTLKDTDMSDQSLADYAGKIKLISIVPSLDTPVCDVQTRRFNEEAGKLGDGVVVLTISVDLPPAMKRWCGAAGIENVVCLSDFKDHTFGKDYGVRIKEIGLLSRTIFVVDQDNVIRYIERVPEVTQEPDYGKALEAVKALQ